LLYLFREILRLLLHRTLVAVLLAVVDEVAGSRSFAIVQQPVLHPPSLHDDLFVQGE
jgi:hypothetical protein